MQGSMAADGTAWALRIIAGPVPQLGALMPWGLEPGRKTANNWPYAAAKTVMAITAAARAMRRALQRCS